MNKLSYVLIGFGVLLIVGSALLLVFPDFMRYPYAITGILTGAFLIVSMLRSQKPARRKDGGA